LNNLEKHTISVTYENKDCVNGSDWIKKDIINEISKQLNIENKPRQATVTLVYTSIINGSENDNDIKG